ncbi:6-hydroxymethylpterin diphosphokinase MptE-like protein [Aeromonas caviae]
MNIEQSIEFLEAEVIRLRQQQEQEKAMAEVLPVRFRDNMLAFQKYIPKVYEQFEDYRPTRPFRFFCNENGIPNLLWLDENTSLYGEDPFGSAQEQINQILNRSVIHRFNFGMEADLFNQAHVQYLNKMCELYGDVESRLKKLTAVPDSIPMVMMFGVGLGYHLSYLYEKCSVKNLFAFEPDLDLFYASLFSFDWYSLLSHLNQNGLSLHLFLGQDEDSLMGDLLPALHKRGAFWISSMFGFWHYPSEEIFSLVERVRREFYLITSGWGFFDDNLFALAHSAKNIDNGVPFLLKGKDIASSYPDLPVLVIGNGPSLDEAIPFIKENKEKFLLFACGSSITALHKAGIKPDILLAIERTKGSVDFLKLLNDDEYLRDILFLSADVIHPDCRHYFDRIAVGFKPFEPMNYLLARNIDDARDYVYLNGVNPLVGNTGLSYAITLGFKELYLCGIDNGYKSAQHHHSKYSAYYDDEGQPIEQLTKLVTKSGDILVPGNFGGEVTATRLFCVSIKAMESLLKLNPEVSCFNCSDGALINHTTPLQVSNIPSNHNAFDKKVVIDHIYENFFSPIKIERGEISSLLAFDIFDDLLSRMISDWRNVNPMRESISELMQKHFEYLIYISETNMAHVYRTLVGSINYYFSFINTIIYTFDDVNMKEDVVIPAIGIMIDFFEVMRISYPKALEFIDDSESEILDLYRRGAAKCSPISS